MSVSRQNTSAMRGCARRKVVRDECDLGRNDCRQAVIHDLQVQALEVGDVARDVKGHKLASALGKDLVAAGEPSRIAQHCEGRSWSRTISASALSSRTMIGRAVMARLSSSETGAMLSSLRISGAR